MKPQTHIERAMAIIAAATRHFGISELDLRGHHRAYPLVRARHIAIWVIYEDTKLNYDVIGCIFNARDRTSIRHAHRKINADSSPETGASITAIRKLVQDAARDSA